MEANIAGCSAARTGVLIWTKADACAGASARGGRCEDGPAERQTRGPAAASCAARHGFACCLTKRSRTAVSELTALASAVEAAPHHGPVPSVEKKSGEMRMTCSCWVEPVSPTTSLP